MRATLLLLTLLLGAAPAQADRAAAEQAIRQTLYELEYAYATGDVETVKRLTARRTLGLYRLYFDLVSAQLPRADEPAGGEDLFDVTLKAVAGALGESQSPERLRERARANARRPITWLSEGRAQVAGVAGDRPSLVVLEDGLWKADETESVKADLLKTPGLTPAEKKRLKDF